MQTTKSPTQFSWRSRQSTPFPRRAAASFNMGCDHDRENSSGSRLDTYSYGWHFNGTNRTIMAYAPGKRIQRFSNPNVSYFGVPTGVPLGANNEAYNARTINNSASTVANFRAAVISTNLALLHPADIAPSDNMIGIDEATAYGAAWKFGTNWPVGPNPVPLDYAVRAGHLYKSDSLGRYAFVGSLSNAPLCWVSTNSLGCDPLEPLDPRPLDLSDSSAVRSMTNLYVANVPIAVTLTITPGTNVGAYAVQEQAPIGWPVTSVGQGGTNFGASGIIKWQYYDPAPRTLTYQITPPSDATGVATLAGVASFDGVSLPFSGVREILPNIGPVREIAWAIGARVE
jgi:hypothetical protein